MLSAPAALRRYESEIAYFDREAEEASRRLTPLDPLVVERYRVAARQRFNKEHRLSLVRPLEGKRVLEIGCGDGEQAVLLATLGANVTGIDISPKSVALAQQRADLAGVASRARFVCAPLAEAEVEEDGFDVVWGDGILHHVIPDLDAVLERVVAWAKPGARVVITEPVSLSPTFRKVRCMLPIPLQGTPDERPLERAELDIIARHLPSLRIRPYLFLARSLGVVFGDYSYERASAPMRAFVDAVALADQALLSLPPLARFAGQVVMYATVSK